MRILIFNWRDLKNPVAGGAEVLTHEVSRRWAAQGHAVTLLTSRFPGSAAEETVDGVRIIRCGGPRSIYWRAARVYRRRFCGRVDVVIDEVNTLPFFTPWYVREPIVMHFNQMAREVWFYECPWPLNLIGFWLEPWWLRLYRNVPAMTISESSRQDLVALGFPSGHVHVIPMGIDHAPRVAPVLARASVPTVLYVGRLKRSKRVDHVLQAFQMVRSKCPEAQLWIVGDGDRLYRQRLHRMANGSGANGAIRWFGRVSDVEKQQLMAQAHLIVVTSIREGWGLIVTEANRHGTPAIVYRVPGLVDSTQDGVNGLVCRQNTPQALAEALTHLLDDSPRRERLAEQAKASAATMTWDRAAETALAVLQHHGRSAAGARRRALGSLTIVLPTSQAWVPQRATLEQVAMMVRTWPAPCDLVLFGPDTETAPLAEAVRQHGVSPDRLSRRPYDPARGRYLVLPQAVEWSCGEWVWLVDPAVACASGLLSEMVKAAEAGADLVTVAKAEARLAKPWWFRASLYRWWQTAVRWLFGLTTADVQTGLKLCRAASLRDVVTRIVGKEFAFDLELIAVAHRLGYRIASVPLRLSQPLPIGRLRLTAALRILLDTLAVAYRMFGLRYYDRAGPSVGEEPFVSIVIAVSQWNPYLTECLERCLVLDYPAYEVIVLPDDSCEPMDSRIRVIPTGPISPGAKRNQGVAAARGEVIAFLDDDALPTAQWLRHAVRHFADPSIGAVGGPAPTPAHDSWRQQISGLIYGTWMMGGSKSYRYIPHAARAVRDLPTCNLLIRRSTLDAAGGFDSRFWPGEDSVLCSKIVRDLRQVIWYDPDVLVYHHRRPIFGPHLRQLRRYAEHRGYFVKRVPANSLEAVYFLPSILVIGLGAGWMPALWWPAWGRAYLIGLLIYLSLAWFTGLRGLSLPRAFAAGAGIIASNMVYGLYFLKGLFSRRLAEEVAPMPRSL